MNYQIFVIHATCPAYPVLLDLIMLTAFCDKYEL
jgi:hypothetical protein